MRLRHRAKTWVSGSARNSTIPGSQPSALPLKLRPQILELAFGIEPKSAVYESAALPLSYASMVGAVGIEPTSPCLKGRRSAFELRSRLWPSDSN